MRYYWPDVDWYYASGRLRAVRQGVTFGRTVFLQLLLGIQHIVNPLSCSNVQMAEILKWGKIVFERVHDVLMLKILKGDEDCWSTKSNPDWRQTDLWYITKANRLPWGLSFAHFLFLWESIPYLKRWLSFGGQFLLGQISRTFIRVQRKDQKVSDTHGWHSGRSAATMRDCLKSEKCCWRSVWEVLKCLRSVEVSESLLQSVEPEQSSECEVKSKSKKRWDCWEEARAQSALPALQRSTQSDKNSSSVSN